jgi:hypothetical protein
MKSRIEAEFNALAAAKPEVKVAAATLKKLMKSRCGRLKWY